MRILKALLSAALLLAVVAAVRGEAAAAAAAPANVSMTAVRPSIIAIGDGLTESAFLPDVVGWGSLLAANYTRRADVVNRGYGGYYTPWLVDYALGDMFTAPRPLLAIIFLGVKDSLTKEVTGSHYISPEVFGSNVNKIIQRGKSAGVTRFLLITPPPVCEVCRTKVKPPWDRNNTNSALYVNQLSRLAASTPGAALVDIFNPWQKEPSWNTKYLAPDNLHLSEGGNRAVHKAILATLQQKMPEVLPRNLPWVLPPQFAIGKNTPEEAFKQMQQQDTKRGQAAGGLVLPGTKASNSGRRLTASSSSATAALGAVVALRLAAGA